MSAIRVVGLSKSYGERPVLRGLSLSVEKGECLVLFGANGSGKTTLLKVISTLARPDAGQVWVGGVERNQDPNAIRRMIGVVAHQHFLYENLTCQENLLFYGRMFSVSGLKSKIAPLLQQVGLEEHAHQPVRSLSHGMQKRLALARAVLHNPSILLLDEPESGLDQEGLKALHSLFTDESGVRRTVLVATHNLEQGLAIGDRVAILAGGKIAYEECKADLDPIAFRGKYVEYIGIGQ